MIYEHFTKEYWADRKPGKKAEVTEEVSRIELSPLTNWEVQLKEETLEETRERYCRLNKYMKWLGHLYHCLDSPDENVSDIAYDQMFKRLKAYEEKYPTLQTEISLTSVVGCPCKNKPEWFEE